MMGAGQWRGWGKAHKIYKVKGKEKDSRQEKGKEKKRILHM